MKNNKTKLDNQSLGVFQKHLTIWGGLCIIIGILIGKYIPSIPKILSQFEYYKVSIPVAILILLMIYPIMLKVDFSSVVDAIKKPKGLIVTCVSNCLLNLLQYI